MNAGHRIKDVAFLSTYPPRECGLATFTEDLVNEIDKIDTVNAHVIAISASSEIYEDPRVAYKLNQHDRNSYFQAAQWANTHVDLLVIEHEYGIFGGECGCYILDFAKALTIPFIVTTHTVLLEPSPAQQSVMQELGRLADKVITMARSSIPILAGLYGIGIDKLAFIPHGVPDMKVKSRTTLKNEYGLNNKRIVSSFGLLSPAKGLEYGIEAVAKVVPEYPDLIYLILGKTHPCVKASMGESYRQGLLDLAQKLGVQDNVQFIDKYLTKQEVITYLHLSDMYLTPYLSKEQAVSGTLAYAMGCGRVIISTPYRYAEEMLGEGRGLLARFKDADSMAGCIRTVLGNRAGQAAMERKTLKIGRDMIWANVAAQYVELGVNLVEAAEKRTRQSAWKLVRPTAPVLRPLTVLTDQREMSTGI